MYKTSINFDARITLIIMEARKGTIKSRKNILFNFLISQVRLESRRLERNRMNLSYTLKASAIVEPETPGSNSAIPTKKPETINLSLSFKNLTHLQTYLGALVQMKHHHTNLAQLHCWIFY